MNVQNNGAYPQSVHGLPQANWCLEIVLIGQVLASVVTATVHGEWPFYLYGFFNLILFVTLVFWRTRCCTAVNATSVVVAGVPQVPAPLVPMPHQNAYGNPAMQVSPEYMNPPAYNTLHQQR